MMKSIMKNGWERTDRSIRERRVVNLANNMLYWRQEALKRHDIIKKTLFLVRKDADNLNRTIQNEVKRTFNEFQGKIKELSLNFEQKFNKMNEKISLLQ